MPLITYFNPKSPEAEAFKVLRTNLQFLKVDEQTKTILFTSVGPDEGKSTVLANLAVSLAQVGKKVLVVDCDLRRPVQHRIFGHINHKGLTSVLSETDILEEVIQKTDAPGVFILTTGLIPPNPAELLSSDRMQIVLEKLEDMFDIVMIDSPPILAVTDAVILASMVDGVILITLAGRTVIDKAKEAKEKLLAAGAKILGVVLNGVERSRNDHYYYYYYGDKK
ncbi:MAG: capsular biosynthesis protein [Firmicutes bacterium HGW-Firmicutes-12]|nr:MAG: capsular biosynthesis protein [Firmicutes bacterium HGW-Firmicutes-12]